MSKKIAVVNDLAGFGRCSLVASISVISAMGVQPCPLPTVILSAQTGFANYFYDDYTDNLGKIADEWKKMNAAFDGIMTGFMSCSDQIRIIHRFLDSFHTDHNFLLVDPVLGDNGKRFTIFDEEFQKEMKKLVCRANIVTPNMTELCLLTGADYREFRLASEAGDNEQVRALGEKAASVLLEKGVSEVVVTGLPLIDAVTREKRVGNLLVRYKEKNDGVNLENVLETELYEAPFIGQSYSGTGDLFASVLAAGKAEGLETSQSIHCAQEFIQCSIRDAFAQNIPGKEGVEYERHLHMLRQYVE